MIKITIFLVLALSALALEDAMKSCYSSGIEFKDSVYSALEKNNIDQTIDELQKVFQTYPALLESCGDDDKAAEVRKLAPPTCTKSIASEAKLLVKILRLYSEDREKNQNAIIVNEAIFTTMYKKQVQKKCPLLADYQMMEVKNKGECAEGMYQLSLTFEKLDNDLAAGKFNASLTDMGKVIQKLPDTLDSCSQQKMAKWVRTNFPAECLSAIGTLVRELATLEHNYTHIEWLKKHIKDFTSALFRVKAACPAISK